MDFKWYDADSDGVRDNGEIYLITIPKEGDEYKLYYYQVMDSDGDGRIEDGELIDMTSSPPDAIRPRVLDSDGNPTSTFRTAEQERQNFADWFSFYRRRMLTAKAAVGLTVDDMDQMEMGIHTINHTLSLPLKYMPKDICAEKDAFLRALYDIDASGYTPLRRGLYEVGKYFEKGNSGDYSSLTTTAGLDSGDDSVFYEAGNGGSCQRAFAIMMTDGYYNGRFSTIGNADNDGAPDYGTAGAPLTYDTGIFGDSYRYKLADIAMHFYERDLDPGLDDLVPARNFDLAPFQHMVTFGISFGVFGDFDPELYPDCLPDCEPGEQDCPNKGDVAPLLGEIVKQNCSGPAPCPKTCPEWYDITRDTSDTIDDMFHASVNGRGKFLNAANPQELIDSMKAIKKLIQEQTGSASSVTLNAREIKEGALLFQTIYQTDNWSGDILAKCLDAHGDVVICPTVTECKEVCSTEFDTCTDACGEDDTACKNECSTRQTDCDNYCDGFSDTSTNVRWSASEQLDAVDQADRSILTWDKDLDGGKGVDFTFTSLSDSMKTLIDSDTDAGGKAQKILEFIRGDKSNEKANGGTFRDRASKLGDFIHSEPFHYQNSTIGIDHVFVGSNDGMLHVIDSKTGTEIMGYVPAAVFSNLADLTDPTYKSSHKFYVDGLMHIGLWAGSAREARQYTALISPDWEAF